MNKPAHWEQPVVEFVGTVPVVSTPDRDVAPADFSTCDVCDEPVVEVLYG
jgi:hypothetical protein